MKKKEMKELLLNNLGWKLLSLILAAAAWIVIVNVDDPVITKIIQDVPVEITNESAVQEKDKVYDVVEGSKVSVYIKGKRKSVDSVGLSDIRAVADLSALSNWNAVPIIVSCPSKKDLEVSLTGEVQTLKINLEDKVTEQYQINVETVGMVEDGYYIGKTEAKPNLIKVSGGRSAIDKIEEIRVTLDVTDVSENVEQTLEPKAYDKDGEEIVNDTLVFATNKIRVKANVLPTRLVPVVVYPVGEAAYGYYQDSIEYEPKEVLLAGEADVLSAINEIPVEVDIKKAVQDKEVSVELNELLPSGVVAADNNTTISIKIVVEKMTEKEYRIAVDRIELRNIPDGKICNLNLMNSYVSVKVMGTDEQISALSESDFLPYLDLKDCVEGSYTREVQFEELFNGSVIISKPTISLTIEELKPEESEVPEESSEKPEKPEEAEETEPPAEMETQEPQETETIVQEEEEEESSQEVMKPIEVEE